MRTDRKGFAEINTSTSGDNTIIAAPSVGHIEIDHLEIMPTGGANTVRVKLDGAGGSTGYEYAFDDNQAYVYDRTTDNPITVSEATALILNLSASTKVTGFVSYRIVGE